MEVAPEILPAADGIAFTTKDAILEVVLFVPLQLVK